MTLRRISSFLAVALGVAAFAGCGGDSDGDEGGFDYSEVESRINSDYYATTFYQLEEISCDGGGIGEAFSCDAVNRDGDELEMTGKVNSVKTVTRTIKGKKQDVEYTDFDYEITKDPSD